MQNSCNVLGNIDRISSYIFTSYCYCVLQYVLIHSVYITHWLFVEFYDCWLLYMDPSSGFGGEFQQHLNIKIPHRYHSINKLWYNIISLTLKSWKPRDFSLPLWHQWEDTCWFYFLCLSPISFNADTPHMLIISIYLYTLIYYTIPLCTSWNKTFNLAFNLKVA